VRVIIAASTVAIVAVAAVIIVALVALIYILAPRRPTAPAGTAKLELGYGEAPGSGKPARAGRRAEPLEAPGRGTAASPCRPRRLVLIDANNGRFCHRR
jgi:hypothetical protein